MSHKILADVSASISELKKNPMDIATSGDGFPVAILNRNKPVFYCIPAKSWEDILNRLEDIELASIANERLSGDSVEVSFHDL